MRGVKANDHLMAPLGILTLPLNPMLCVVVMWDGRLQTLTKLPEDPRLKALLELQAVSPQLHSEELE